MIKNKPKLLTTIGVMILIIGTSFLIGTIYRSTNNFTPGLLAGSNTQGYGLSMPFSFSSRNCIVELALNVPVDVYLLDANGLDRWLSEGVIEPVWFAKNVLPTETLSINLACRDNYSFLLVNSDNLTISGLLYPKLYGFERDLLWFSLTTLIAGLVFIAVSRLLLPRKNEKSIAVVLKKDHKIVYSKETMPSTPQTKLGLDKSKSLGQLCRLVVWEFDEYFVFPMLEVVVVVAVLTVLTPTIVEVLPFFSYNNLISGIRLVFLFLIFVSVVLFCHSYAGSISKGETKLLLSYPVQRSKLFLSKFITLFVMFLVVYVCVFALQIYLLALSPFEPMFYVSLLLMAIQLLLICSIATALSVVTKNELLSILVSVILLFGIENVIHGGLATFAGRFTIGFTFVRQQIHGGLSLVSMFDMLVSVFVVLGVSVLLFVFSYVYFTRKMEID
ncbi:MAG: ABC transporter permease [Nitrososphaerota archaeon]|jgi:ABC-type transport system involved in multi-copper enzyme maturation permease subunit|nr:ABC transporter permease [Nitrososphaerota archaeon]